MLKTAIGIQLECPEFYLPVTAFRKTANGPLAPEDLVRLLFNLIGRQVSFCTVEVLMPNLVLSLTSRGGRYFCPMCPYHFTGHSELIEHMQEHVQ